jgi:ribonuclease P protein component
MLKRGGVSLHGKFMVLSVLKNQPAGGSTRLAIITSRRVGTAVARNRVRRRLREIVRVDRRLLTPGCWVALIARQRAVEASFSQIRDEWRALAIRASVLEQSST